MLRKFVAKDILPTLVLVGCIPIQAFGQVNWPSIPQPHETSAATANYVVDWEAIPSSSFRPTKMEATCSEKGTRIERAFTSLVPPANESVFNRASTPAENSAENRLTSSGIVAAFEIPRSNDSLTIDKHDNSANQRSVRNVASVNLTQNPIREASEVILPAVHASPLTPNNSLTTDATSLSDTRQAVTPQIDNDVAKANPNRLASSLQPRSEGKYDVADFIGPPSDPASLFSALQQSNAFVHSGAELGPEIRGGQTDGIDSLWSETDYAWVTPTFYYQTLYFEQVNLERYGIGPAPVLKPIYSAAHFFGSISLAPYKLVKTHPCEKVYPLGYARPGSCAKYQRHTIQPHSSN